VNLDKYKTKEKIKIKCKIGNVEGKPIVHRDGYVYRACLGDLIKDYFNHLKIPKWRRMFILDWKINEEKIREQLNYITFSWEDL